MLYFLSSQVRRRWMPTRERQCCLFNPSSLLVLFVENKWIENETDPSPVLMFRWRYDDAILSDTGTRWKRISTMERCYIRGYTNARRSAWLDSTESKSFATDFSIIQCSSFAVVDRSRQQLHSRDSSRLGQDLPIRLQQLFQSRWRSTGYSDCQSKSSA